jgi:acetyl-CoA C-acetyltransferase
MRLAIIDGVRTPIGSLGGALKDQPAQKLAELVLREALARTKTDPESIEEVILGCCGPSSDAPNLARVAALMAGLPIRVPAYTVMRNCASGMQAIESARQNLIAGAADVQVVGGVESMSTIPFVSRDMRFGKKLRNSELIDSLWEGLTDPICNQIMGRTAENLVEEFKITRSEQDRYAVQSHQKAFRATREGRLKEEIVPVRIVKKIATREVEEQFKDDECINVALNEQMLALYPTVFKEGGTVTPGNSCPISDGACALMVMSEQRAKEKGLSPLGVLRSTAFVGLEPQRMGMGPALAAPLAAKRAGVEMKDIRLFELNEAFAAQSIAVLRTLNLDPEIVNVNGGAIALGHPVGFSGARIVLTLLKEMRRRKLGLGMAMLCVGGGQGAAMVLEAP